MHLLCGPPGEDVGIGGAFVGDAGNLGSDCSYSRSCPGGLRCLESSGYAGPTGRWTCELLCIGPAGLCPPEFDCGSFDDGPAQGFDICRPFRAGK